MLVTIRRLFFVSLLIQSIQMPVSVAMENDPDVYSRFYKPAKKMVDSPAQRTEAKPATDLVGDSIRCIASIMSLPDALRLECVSRDYFAALSHSFQYQALIQGWEGPLRSAPATSEKTAREKFMELKKNNGNYMVHLADLWLEYFPLGLMDHRLPLIHYWDGPISFNHRLGLTKINELYFGYETYYSYNLKKKPPQIPEYSQRAKLGLLLTSVKLDWNFMEAMKETCVLLGVFDQLYVRRELSTIESDLFQRQLFNQNGWAVRSSFYYMSQNQRLTRILERSDVSEGTWSMTHFLYAVNLQVDTQNDATTIDVYRSVVSNPYTDPYTRNIALYFLAEMERRGRGIADTDREKAFQSAHIRYKAIISSRAAHPLLRSIALLSRANMLELGNGVNEPDPDMAEILRNSAKEIAQRF